MTTYAKLAIDVAAWSSRSDLATVLPTMCELFESRVNRGMRVRQMEGDFTGTIADSVIAQPGDFLEFKRLHPAGYPKQTVHPQTLELVRMRIEGIPTHYALDGVSVRFNGTGDVAGTYYKPIPHIVTAGFNWLSVAAYDAYLWGVLSEVYGYQRDPEEQQKALSRSQAILEGISGADKRLTGPLVARAV